MALRQKGTVDAKNKIKIAWAKLTNPLQNMLPIPTTGKRSDNPTWTFKSCGVWESLIIF
jgi:hypothetical protein